MNEHGWLAERFEEHRAHLRAVAYRMLGSLTEADDAVQDARLRVSQAEASEIERLGAWLTTIVARVCLNMLRSRTARREDAPARPRHPTRRSTCNRRRRRCWPRPSGLWLLKRSWESSPLRACLSTERPMLRCGLGCCTIVL